MENKNINVSPEQIKYANILFYGSWGGIILLGISFILYYSGILTPFIPPSIIPSYWEMSAHDYNHALNLPTGWGWLGMLKYGDFLNFIGIAFLGIITILGYLILFPAYLKNKDYSYATIAGLEIIILLIAISGVIRIGH